MSRVFVMSEHSSVVLEWLREGRIPGLMHVHKPRNGDGSPNPWPDAVTDGVNYGWFESNMLLFWGSHSSEIILERLKRACIDTKLLD